MNQPQIAGAHKTSIRQTLTLFVVLLVAVAGLFRLMLQFGPDLPAFVPELLGAALLTMVGLTLRRYTNAHSGNHSGSSEPSVAEQIIEQVTEGILTINERGQLVSLNPAAERLFGYRFQELRNQPVTCFLTEPPCDNKKLFHDTITMGTVLGLAAGAREMIGRRKNGDSFPLELTMSGMTLGDDQVTVAFARDVSKRKQAQRYLTAHYAATCLLAETNSLAEALPQILQALSDALQWDACAYWSLDPSRNELNCAGVYKAPFSANPKPLDAKTLTCQLDQGLVGRVWTSGKPDWSEDMLRSDDDSCFGLAAELQLRGAFAFPVLMCQEVCGVLALFSSQKQKRDPWLTDIMSEFGKQLGHFIARKRDEEMLQHSEERFRQLAENIHEVFWMVDTREDRVIYVSPSCEEVWGRSSAHFMVEQNALLKFVHPEDRARVLASYQKQKHGEVTGEEYRIVRPDQSIRWISSRAFPVTNSAGQVYRIVGIMVDITDQKQLEERLRQAQKMEAVGQLAGGVAHDFNNLLTVILGYGEILLAQTKPTHESYELLEQIQKAGERAASLTRQLLAFGRKQTLQVKVLNINDIVQDMTKLLRRMIGEDITMIVNASPTLGQVQADPSQVERILMNLASNARDAMPTGGSLTFSTSNVELLEAKSRPDSEMAAGSYVLLTVTDTGMGMDEVTRLHAFEPFFTTKDVGKGTGLGLATVYGIIKQSNGHIELESQVGHGTTFRIYLPQLATPGVQTAELELPSAIRRGKETLLLVEDEEIVRRLTSHILQSSGYTVLTASSGEEALQFCREHEGEISLLVTDILMPEMNGVRLAELALEVRKDMKVLFISGYSNNILESYGNVDSSSAFLSKPVSPKVLTNKVREMLDSPTSKAAC